MIPDESYWSMLAQHLGHHITGDLTTYMEPGDPKTGHSAMFRESDVARLWKTPVPNFFARKFPTTPKMDRALELPIKQTRGIPTGTASVAAAEPGAVDAPSASAGVGKGKGKGKGKGPGKGPGAQRRW